ncbi:ATP-binding protein [Alteromonas australica]|nr:ATP-binding protein [Alteromonas australica]
MTMYRVLLFTLTISFYFCALPIQANASDKTNVHAELAQFEARLSNERPMPIGEITETLEAKLNASDYSLEEKRHLGALYTALKLRLHHTPSKPIYDLLSSLADNSPSGMKIKLGLARIDGINAKYDSAYTYFGELINADFNDKETKAYALAYLILTYNEAQVFASSAELLNTLEELSRELASPKLTALYYYMLADYNHSIQSYDIAYNYYKKSLALAQEHHFWVLISDNLYVIGILFRNQGQYEKAISYFEKTIENDKNIDMSYSEYLALYGMASTYFRTDDIDKALAMADKVTSHPLTASFYDSEIYRLKAKALLKVDRLKEAREALDMSRAMYNDYRTDEKTTWRADLEKLAAEITAKEGDFQTAYYEYIQFHNDYVEAKKYEELELLESADLINQIAQQKERALQLEAQNQAYLSMLEAKEAAQQTQKLYTRWLIVFVVLTLLTLATILVLFKKAKQSNALTALAKEKAELHNRLKTEFISNISHEIRTPLNAIIGFGQVLTEKLQDKDTKKLTNQIVNSSEMLLQLINDLLDFSKIEAGKLALDYGPYNLRHSLKKLADIFHAQAANKGLAIVFNIDKALPKQLIYDELRVKQVLANLISNAIKFSTQGHIEIGVHVIRLTEQDCTLEIWVKDQGIGISETQKENLFQPFIQAESSTARKYGGSGLGLNISNKLLQLMNSQIAVESDIGKGSRFSFTLTLLTANQHTPLPVDKPAPVLEFSKTHVLLAEDNDINVEVIQAMLAATNLQITRVKDGNQAIHAFADKGFDIILMDIQMPEMDGYEATRVLRQQMGVTHPIVALTANAMQQDIDACFSAGMDAHISKPIQKENLMTVLQRFLQ